MPHVRSAAFEDWNEYAVNLKPAARIEEAKDGVILYANYEDQTLTITGLGGTEVIPLSRCYSLLLED